MSRLAIRTCRRKKAHLSVAAAWDGIYKSAQDHRASMSMYCCDVCRHLHLTSRYFDRALGQYAYPVKNTPDSGKVGGDGK